MLRLWDYKASYLMDCSSIEQGVEVYKDFLKNFRYNPNYVLFWVDEQGFNTIVKEWENA